MSFSMTTEQYRHGEKTVTRRDGWWFLNPGDVVMGCEKCMGLKKGQKVQRMHPLRVVSTTPEPLRELVDHEDYGASEMVREGFWDYSPMDFCEMYIKHNGGGLDTLRNRIEFEHTEVTP